MRFFKFFSVGILFFIFIIGTVPASVFINEIEANPPGGDNEWVEFYNSGNEQNLSGWYSRNADGDRYFIPHESVGANSFFVINGFQVIEGTKGVGCGFQCRVSRGILMCTFQIFYSNWANVLQRQTQSGPV